MQNDLTSMTRILLSSGWPPVRNGSLKQHDDSIVVGFWTRLYFDEDVYSVISHSVTIERSQCFFNDVHENFKTSVYIEIKSHNITLKILKYTNNVCWTIKIQLKNDVYSYYLKFIYYLFHRAVQITATPFSRYFIISSGTYFRDHFRQMILGMGSPEALHVISAPCLPTG